MKKFLCIILLGILCGVFAYSPSVFALKLGSMNISGVGGGVPYIITSSTQIDLDILYNYPTPNYPKIFDSLTISTTDIGTEFFATSSSGSSPDPGFNDFVSSLTNGIDELIYFDFININGRTESSGFGTTPDFKGYTIDSLGFVMEDFSLDIPGSDLFGDGQWTDYQLSMTLNVYGNPVPEPTTMLLLGSGLVGLAGFGRKKFKK